MPGLIVAIDGPAGSGKSSVSRVVAGRLQLPHLDTGSYYRAATLVALRNDVDLADGIAIVRALDTVDISNDAGITTVDGRSVEGEIRSADVTAAVSQVSAHPEVRQVLVDQQRRWVELRGGNAVVEGRDIGTVVFPHAALKIFLTADEAERARRRARERGEEPGEHLDAIRQRDALDGGRTASPLRRAEDAIVLDTTYLPIGEVADLIASLAAAVQA